MVLWHSNLVQKLCNIRTIQQVLLFIEKNGGTLHVCCGRRWERELFYFNLDGNSSAEDFDKPRTRSFSSIWEKGCGASSSGIISSSFSSTPEESSSLMSGSSPMTGTGISSQWATGRRADWRSGYLRLLRFFLLIPAKLITQSSSQCHGFLSMCGVQALSWSPSFIPK